MLKSTGTYPSLIVDTTAQRAVSHAGAVLLAATATRVGLDRELSTALEPWMRCMPRLAMYRYFPSRLGYRPCAPRPTGAKPISLKLSPSTT